MKCARNNDITQEVVYQQLIFRGDFPITRNTPFGQVIWSVSEAKTYNITPLYGRNQTLKRAETECDMDYRGLHNKVCYKTIKTERAFLMMY